MAFNSKVLYEGNGSQTTYSIPFSYIQQTHVEVYRNLVLQTDPSDYSISSSSVVFVEAPGDGDAIEIKRNSSPGSILVDFQNGSVLNEGDLDLAYLHNFYLTQEATDGYNTLVNDTLLRIAGDLGISETDTDEIINCLTIELLAQDAAATLQARVTDIDTNAASIISLGNSLQIQINNVAEGIASAVWVQASAPVPGVDGVPDPIVEGSRWYDSDDNNSPYIYLSSAWVGVEDPRIGEATADIVIIESDVADNAAAIVTESVTRANADSATASTLALIGAENGAQTAFVLDSTTVKIDSDGGDTFSTRFSNLSAADATNAADITTEESARIAADGTISAKYGVNLDVNGYVTGFLQINDGTSGAFIIQADQFAVVDPLPVWEASTAYTEGDYVTAVTPVADRIYRCFTSGTSGGSEPTWNATYGLGVIDNTTLWITEHADNEVIPFLVQDSVVTMQNVVIDGSLLVANSVTAAKLEADLVLAGLIRTAGSGNRVELEQDSAGDFPFWIGSGSKGTVSGSPGSGARVFYDASIDELEITGSLKAETFSASAFTPISEVTGVDNGLNLSDYDPTRVALSVAPIWYRPWDAQETSAQALTYNTTEKEVQGPTYDGTAASDSFKVASYYTTMTFDMSFLVEGDVDIEMQQAIWNEGTTSWGSWTTATLANTFASQGSGVAYNARFCDSFQPSVANGRVKYRYQVTQGTGDTGYVWAYGGAFTIFNMAESP